MVIIKTAPQIDGIRRSSQLAAATLSHVASFITPGITTDKLNSIAHKYILDHHAVPAPLNYGGFPKSICTSVNQVVCHGIPSPQQLLTEGDIVNLDITTILDGYYGDTSATYPVGKISPLAQKLIDTTQQSLNLAIKSLKPGKLLNDCVGRIIQPFVEKQGFSVVQELGGHGVGLKFHEDPFVYHFDHPKEKIILQPGMIFTIEPMINASKNYQVTLDKNDAWTIRTFDGSLSAQFEHTILITSTGSEILTRL
jgi:methionyl aminopeptidase